MRGDAVRRVLLQVLVLNLVVVGAKLLAWRSSGALSIVAEVIHSSLDALNNVIALVFARIAAMEPDEEHPYGHHKFERIGALVVVGLLSVTVFELASGALRRLLAAGEAIPSSVAAPDESLVLMTGSILAGIAVAGWERKRGRELDSPILMADAAHTSTDVWAATAVLLGLLAVRAGYPLADPVITLWVAGMIGWTGWSIVRETVPDLVDERAFPEDRIRAGARSVAGVQGTADIRSRGRSGEVFVELTILVDPELDVRAAHRIADAVENELRGRLGARHVTVHVEPGRHP